MKNSNKKPGGVFKKLLIGIVVIIFLGTVFGGGDDTGSKQSSASAETPAVNSTEEQAEETKAEEVVVKPELTVTAKEIYEAFESNELMGNKTYKDKIIAVEGIVSSIDEVFGSYSVSIDDGEDFSLVSVICSFDDSKEEQLIPLEKGQKITIIGLCDGYNGLSVSIEDSTVAVFE